MAQIRQHNLETPANRQNNIIIGNYIKTLLNSQKNPSTKLKNILEKLRHQQALTQADLLYLSKATARKKFS